jgi:peptidoglycan/xylan/chitin deacetylase (PgdA/CDA1 family)
MGQKSQFWLLLCAILFLALCGSARAEALEKLIVLTFDDGPKTYVLYGLDMKSHKPTGKPGLLKVLEDAKVPAHFFVIGFKAREQKDIVRDLSLRGFLFENHTDGHDVLPELEKRRGLIGVKSNLRAVDTFLTELTGRKPKYFRPRSWIITSEEEQFIREEFGYTVLKLGDPDLNMIDYEFYDKKKSSVELADYVKSRILSRERAGLFRHVLAFHELPNTVGALEELLPYFKSLGYRFVTLDEYMNLVKKEVVK